jgi:hypothetical protein
MARDSQTILIGWRTWPGGSYSHYWQSRSYMGTVVSACGRITNVDLLQSEGDTPRCYACDTLMKLRPGTAAPEEVIAA